VELGRLTFCTAAVSFAAVFFAPKKMANKNLTHPSASVSGLRLPSGISGVKKHKIVQPVRSKATCQPSRTFGMGQAGLTGLLSLAKKLLDKYKR